MTISKTAVRSVLLASSAALLLGMGSVAMSADGPHEKAIKARKGLMQVYAFNTGILAAMAKGKQDYDAELAGAAAANLLSAVSMKNVGMYPPGSGNDEVMDTRALPEIWSTYPDVADKGKALATAATDLAAAAGNGLDALKSAMGPVGKACKACHDDFRAKDD